MVSSTLQPIAPRSSAKGNWIRTNEYGETVDFSRTPGVEEAIRTLQRAMSYLSEVDGKKSRLASLIGCDSSLVFHWLAGNHTPSAKHLITLLNLVLSQAESEKAAAAGLTAYLQEMKDGAA